MIKEFEVWGNRSDKRYTRAMKLSDVLIEGGGKVNDQILDIYQKLAYISGNLDND